MNTESVLAPYFKEVRSYPTLNKEQEKVLAYNLSREMDNIIDLLLTIPATWTFLLDHYKNLRDNNKAISKMSNFYGSPHTQAKELAERITKAMEYVDIQTKEYYSKVTPKTKDIIITVIKAAEINNLIYFKALQFIKDNEKLEYTKAKMGVNKKAFQYKVRFLIESHERFLAYRNKFLTSNLRLVISFAISYQHLGISLEDLIQEGNVALVRAIEKFDSKKSFKFSTYATWWVKQAFIRLFRNQGRTVRLPSHIHELSAKMSKIAKEVEKNERRTVSNKELAVELDMRVEDIEKIIDLYSDPISLEMEISSGSTTSQVKTLKDFLISENEDPIDVIFEKESTDQIYEALEALPSVHRNVIQFRYGLGMHKPKTLDETSKIVNLSKDKIKKIELQALEALKGRLGDLL